MLNYRHLYYFWVVTKEGGFARAAERLDMAIQTISAQVRELEKALGHQLLKPAGRGVALTEAGQAAFARAEEIFQLGQLIPDEVREAASGKVARLAVGLSDGISKLAAHALLEPVLATPSLRLLCHEGEFEQLLAELALHHLDLVLAGQAAPRNPNLRLTSERLVASPVEWYGPAAHVHQADVEQFPQSLNRLPVLLPTGHSALRQTLDRWFETHGLRPRIVGEFEDSALLAVFAARGLGVFPVSRLGANEVGLMRGLRLLGRCDDVKEEIHAIRSRRGQHHPLALKLIAAATS
jgi:LysR family transcriptional regulator, transcriptional activator of nhaA